MSEPYVTPPGYTPVGVAAVRALAEAAAKDQVLVVAWDRAFGQVHYTTWGRTPDDKLNVADLSDIVCKVISKYEPRHTFEDFRLDAAKNKALVEELVAACEVAVFQLDDHTDTLAKAGRYSEADEIDSVVRSLRAAAAKAKGGTPT